MQALQSSAIKRGPPRCDPIEQCGMAWQPTSSPAVRSTGTFACAREPLLRTLWRALKTIRQLLQYGHGNQISDQIESATCYVQTAAELTEIGSSDTAVAAFRCVN